MAKSELENALCNVALRGLPILVLANCQDKEGARNDQQVCQHLKLHLLRPTNEVWMGVCVSEHAPEHRDSDRGGNVDDGLVRACTPSGTHTHTGARARTNTHTHTNPETATEAEGTHPTGMHTCSSKYPPMHNNIHIF